jgi:hypothetical protein
MPEREADLWVGALDSLENEVFTPEQFAILSAPRRDSPVRHLLWAIFCEAWHTATGRSHNAQEARMWIQSDTRTPTAFSFLDVCEVFDFDVDTLRYRLVATFGDPWWNRAVLALRMEMQGRRCVPTPTRPDQRRTVTRPTKGLPRRLPPPPGAARFLLASPGVDEAPASAVPSTLPSRPFVVLVSEERQTAVLAR